jgi:hypothetical protein
VTTNTQGEAETPGEGDSAGDSAGEEAGVSYRIQYQTIPHLAPNDSTWAWTVSDGTFIVGRFNSREYAEVFRYALAGGNQGAQEHAKATSASEA